MAPPVTLHEIQEAEASSGQPRHPSALQNIWKDGLPERGSCAHMDGWGLFMSVRLRPTVPMRPVSRKLVAAGPQAESNRQLCAYPKCCSNMDWLFQNPVHRVKEVHATRCIWECNRLNNSRYASGMLWIIFAEYGSRMLRGCASRVLASGLNKDVNPLRTHKSIFCCSNRISALLKEGRTLQQAVATSQDPFKAAASCVTSIRLGSMLSSGDPTMECCLTSDTHCFWQHGWCIGAGLV